MVLKKSNSRLNTGATQRGVTHKGILWIRRLGNACVSPHSHDLLHVSVQLRQWDRASVDRLTSCLYKMEENLAWDGPAEIVSRHKAPTGRLRFVPHEHHWYSLEKRNGWLLPGRIKRMMDSVEALSELTSTIGLKVHETQDRLESSRGTTMHNTKSSSAAEIVAKSLEEPTKEQQKKSRRRHTYHGRGVQRPHLFNAGKKQTGELQNAHHQLHDEHRQQEGQSLVGDVDMTVYAPLHINARCTTLKKLGKKFSGYSSSYHRQKSSTKLKGCVNGKNADRRGYTYPGISDDQLDAVNECDKCYDQIDDDQEEDELYNSDTHIRHASVFSIDDLLTQTNSRRKRLKTVKETSQEAEDPVKYPKGSYIVIPKEECSLNQNMDGWDYVTPSDLDESYVSVSDAGYNSRDSQNSESDVERNSSETVPPVDQEKINNCVQLQFENDMSEFDSSFVEVKLLISEDEASWFNVQSSERKKEIQSDDGKYNVSIGESSPPCFLVDFQPHKSQPQENHNMFLVGRKAEPEHDDCQWLVSLQDAFQPPEKTMNVLKEVTAPYGRDGLSLTYFIESVRYFHDERSNHDSFQTKYMHGSPKPKPETKLVSKERSPHSVWRGMPCGVQSSDIATPFEAFQVLQAKSGEQDNPHHFPDDAATENEPFARPSECHICFVPFNSLEPASSAVTLLPCAHIYCASCWRAHVHHSIRNGVVKITCMETKCSCEMDEITMMTLVPPGMWLKWQRFVRDRCIDTSLFCSWCPNDGCGKVALSVTSPLKCQFGSAVVCHCGHCWCSNCRKAPHWPASCDQMTEYSKLLAKFGHSILGLELYSTNYFVQLKPCPKCSYPIEKNAGCPSMVCRMCWHNFCWNCLRDGGSHNLYSCRERSDNFVTYNLQNQLIVPLKFFTECLETIKKIKQISAMRMWLKRLQRTKADRVRLPTSVLCTCDSSTVLEKALDLAEQSIVFIKQTFTLLENWYVLLGFAQSKKGKARRILVSTVLLKVAQLNFIAWRLDTIIIGKSLAQISKSQNRGEILLRAGSVVIAELAAMAPRMQVLTKNVETAWVGKLDPSKILRYK